ncbi:MAG: CAP family protein [Cyanobacteria bacterium P01_C01_bin.89]
MTPKRSFKRILSAAITLTAAGVALNPVISSASQSTTVAEVSTAEVSTAEVSTSELGKSVGDTALNSHNRYRSRHGVPALRYNRAMAARAQAWSARMARTGNFQHSDRSARNGAGENLYVSYTTGNLSESAVVAEAVKGWYDEIEDYNYSRPGFSAATGHFTQVVWKSSTRLGCGVAKGTKNLRGRNFNAYYVTCHYDPPGNFRGQFPANVTRP